MKEGPQPSEEDERLFDQAFRHRGGRLDLLELPEAARKTLWDMRWRGKMLLDKMAEPQAVGAKTKRVVFDFINNREVNAVARTDEGRFFVGFHFGIVRRIYEACFALLSAENLFSDVGKSSGETAPLVEVSKVVFDPPAVAASVSPRLTSESPWSAVFASLLPNDVDRQWYAHELASIAFEYLLYHEFFHAWGGHLEFSVERGFDMELCEGPGSQRSKTPPEISQALEYDADKTAAWILALSVRGQHWMLKSTNYRFVNDESLLHAWAMINGLAFLLLDRERSTGSIRGAYTHPERDVRLWCLYEFFEQSLKSQNQADVAVWQPSFHRAVVDITRLWNAGGHPGAPFKITSAEVDQILAESKNLSDRITGFYPLLRPYDLRQLNSTQRAAAPAPVANGDRDESQGILRLPAVSRRS